MTLITMDGEYKTRDGRPVRVLCVDAYDTVRRAIVLVKNEFVEAPFRYSMDGKCLSYSTDDALDLIPVPKKHKRTVWMVHYPNGACSAWSYNPSHFVNALAITGPHEIEFTEGEGLKGDDDAQAE